MILHLYIKKAPKFGAFCREHSEILIILNDDLGETAAEIFCLQ
jgi:hypothetical protein